MANFPLDLKKFKKVSSDKHTTTLRHDDGHELRIAHNAVSPKMRGELASLKTVAPKVDNKKVDAKRPKMLAEGGSPEDAPTQEPIPAPTPAGASSPITINVGTPQTQAPQAAPQQPQAPQPFTDPTGFLGGNQAYGQPEGSAPIAPSKAPEKLAMAPQQAPAPQAAQPQAQAPQGLAAGAPGPQAAAPQPGAVNDPTGSNTNLAGLQKGLSMQMAGIQGQAQAEGAAAKLKAAALQQSIAQQQTAAANYQTNFKDIDQEYKHWLDDNAKQHVDPNRYMANKSTIGHVATAIGLILGGIGGGLTRKENPALTNLNLNIDRDIAAQKANIEQGNNLLAANFKRFGNLRDATDMTRVMMSGIAQQQLELAAAKTGDQAAKARALQAAGELYAKNAPVFGQIAMRQTMLGGMARGQVTPAQFLRSGIVPEGEKAAVAKDIEQAAAMARFKDNALSAFDQLTKLDTVGNQVMHAGFTPPQVSALTEPLVASMSKELAGKFTEADAKAFSTLLHAKGRSEETRALQRAQLNKFVSEKMNFPMAEQYIPRDLLLRSVYNEQGQSKFKEMPAVLPSK